MVRRNRIALSDLGGQGEVELRSKERQLKNGRIANTRRDPDSRLWTPEFLLIVGIMLSCCITVQAMNTGTTAYVDYAGGPSFLAGLLATVFSLSAAVSRLAFGPIIDKHGRAMVMKAGVLLLAAGTLLPGLLAGESALFIGRFLQGAGFAATNTAASTAAADILLASRLGEGIGYSGLSQAISTAIGPTFALFLVATDPAENLFFVVGGICIFTLGLTFICRYERNYRKLPKTSAYYRRVIDGDTIDHDGSSQNKRGMRRVFELRALPGAIPQTILCASFGFSVFSQEYMEPVSDLRVQVCSILFLRSA